MADIQSPRVNNVSKFTKRSHKKSRNGCTSCKARRVKCDEVHPACASCVRRGTECVYVTTTQKKKTSNGSSPIGFNHSSGVSDDLSYQFEQTTSQAQVQQPPMLSLSPGSVSSASTSTLSDPFGLNQYNMQTPFDPSLLNANSVQFDSPSSIASHEEVNNLLQLATMQEPRTKSLNDQLGDLFDDYFSSNGKNDMVLLSNNADASFPTYLDYTKTNAKLLDYYSTILSVRLSTKPELVNAWHGLVNSSLRFTFLHHIIISVCSLLVHYDIINEAEFPEELEALKNRSTEDYLALDQLNYREYLRECAIVEKQIKKSNNEIISHLASGMLHLLHFLLSPSMTICDPSFFNISAYLCTVAGEVLPYTSCEYQRPPGMSYYNPFSAPKVTPDQCLFFPNYLYQLCSTSLEKEDESILENDDIEEILRDQRSRYEPEPLTSDFEEELEESLLFTIKILKREYALVHNITVKEDDPLRVLCRWASFMPQIFIKSLNEHDPRSLIIVAHYLMLLASIDAPMIPSNSIISEIARIDSVLEDRWKPWIDLPKRSLGMIC